MHGKVQGSGETEQLGNLTPVLGRAIVAGMALQQEVEHRYFGGEVMYGKIASHDAFPVEDDTYDAPMSASARVYCLRTSHSSVTAVGHLFLACYSMQLTESMSTIHHVGRLLTTDSLCRFG